jgi:hypothetical protein
MSVSEKVKCIDGNDKKLSISRQCELLQLPRSSYYRPRYYQVEDEENLELWKVGRWNGQGTFTTSNGSKYEGEWKNGERHGQGTHTYPDGSKYEGEYKDDWELNGTQYDKNGNMKYKYVNGKQIKQ